MDRPGSGTVALRALLIAPQRSPSHHGRGVFGQRVSPQTNGTATSAKRRDLRDPSYLSV